MAGHFKNLVDLLEKSCEAFAQRELFGTKTSSGWTWTRYGEFRKMVDDCRGGLAALGVEEGDKVAIVSDNRVEWAVCAYATYGLGAAFVPMYQVQHPKEWSFILADCGAKVAFAATDAIDAQLRDIAAETDGLDHIIGLDLPADDARSYHALLAQGHGAPVAAAHPAADALAGLIYTSGTTGKPKGVLLSHGNFCSNINALHEVFTELEADDRSLSFLPWAHSFGQTCELHAMLSMGCALAINDEIPNLVSNLAEVRPTVLFAVPRIFNRIYDGVHAQIRSKPGAIQRLFEAGIDNASAKSRGEDIGVLSTVSLWLADKIIFRSIRAKFGGGLRYAISGSAALDKAVAEFIDALGIMVYEGYGLSETSPIVSANVPGARKIGSVGKPLPGVTVEIDESASEEPGEGEIVVRGPNVMMGYHHRPKENAEVLDEDGSFRTGDLGQLDDDGYLYITGRIKEQYKLENGKYVMPAPLEEQLKLSPLIANVLIYGSNKPHNVALVVPDPEATRQLSEEAVRDKIAEELAKRAAGFKSFERPNAFKIIGEDFTTDNGLLTPTLKLKRRQIVNRYQAALDALYEA